MSARIVLAGLAAGLAVAALPAAPASAQCDPQVVTSGSGCSNSCTETGNRVDAATASTREKFAAVPSYWDLFSCTQ